MDRLRSKINQSRCQVGLKCSGNDLSRAHRMAHLLRSGMVWVNAYKRVSPASPFGGVQGSGYGREMGFEAMHEYTQPKSVWINVDAQLPVWYPRTVPGQ